MSNYAWIIDVDHYEEPGTEYSAVGTVGPADANAYGLDALGRGLGSRFRMFDDDDNLVYDGRIIDGKTNSITGFEPLDDFGTPNAECAYIKYRNGRSWGRL